MSFSIKQGDSAPSLQATLLDEDESPVNLTSCTAEFHLNYADGTPFFNKSMTIKDATNGIVRYDWALDGSDTINVGTYYFEIQVNYPDGSKETFPNTTNATLIIYPDLV